MELLLSFCYAGLRADTPLQEDILESFACRFREQAILVGFVLECFKVEVGVKKLVPFEIYNPSVFLNAT